MIQRKSGYYFVQFGGMKRWEIAYWNKTFQYWIYRDFGTTRLKDNIFSAIDPKQIKREP